MVTPNPASSVKHPEKQPKRSSEIRRAAEHVISRREKVLKELEKH